MRKLGLAAIIGAVLVVSACSIGASQAITNDKTHTVNMVMDTHVYLEITLEVDAENRGAAVGVYNKYKQLFLTQVKGATLKSLLVRDEDVQVLHGFRSMEDANAYLKSDLFNKDVVRELAPLLASKPRIHIYKILS